MVKATRKRFVLHTQLLPSSMRAPIIIIITTGICEGVICFLDHVAKKLIQRKDTEPRGFQEKHHHHQNPAD